MVSSSCDLSSFMVHSPECKVQYTSSHEAATIGDSGTMADSIWEFEQVQDDTDDWEAVEHGLL